ncbi:MAG: cobalt ECF transporter T component CbiQ [Synechococcus sp.]
MKSIAIDTYSHLDSPLHRWDARAKLIGLFAIMLAFASIQQLVLLPLLMLLSGLAYWLSKLPYHFWRDRLRWPGRLLFMLALVLPFAGGQVEWLRLGPIAIYQDGVMTLLQVTTRAISILTVGLVLFGTTPFPTLISATRSLGLPAILADMGLLTYRYLYDLGSTLDTMQTALRLRGLRITRLQRSQVPVVASLIGSLLVRSYDQSERIYCAMRLRGYGDIPQPQTRLWPSRRHLWGTGIALAIALGLLSAEGGWSLLPLT